ncbi:hypothetical protein [Aneurinibacillus tyrosinisolvens]|uniref:hypothetical protein n=1 Tax=Aneurinibacillus tyrosinisolvens TaxID=1443435 RepID=UPI00063F3E10|nr:hypothetical protein [Aneurinibacillus tyrosinisolvens]
MKIKEIPNKLKISPRAIRFYVRDCQWRAYSHANIYDEIQACTYVSPNMMGRVQGWLDPLSMLSQSLALSLIAMVFPSAVKIETLFYVIGLSVLFIGGFFLLTLPSLVKKSYGQSQQNIS